MDSYLQTLRNLTRDSYNKPLLHRNSLFPTYEDYLHQHKHKQTHQRQQTEPVNVNIVKEETGEVLSPFGMHSQIQYYPVNRQVIEFEQREVREKMPVRRKVTQFVERKEVELVPKEIIVTDYFAVEHIRKYLKEVVPQVRIETVSVPKIIRREEVTPKERQIVYYPSFRTDLEAAKRDARDYLAKQGVVVRADAEFRPLNHTPLPDTKFTTSKLVETTCDVPDFLPAESKLSPLYKQDKKEGQKVRNHTYLTLARSKHSPSKPSRSSHAKRYSPLPIYKRENYQIKEEDCSFAQRDRYRYEWVMNSSFGRQK